MTTPAIILKSKYIVPSSKEYKNYINYINRDNAKLNLDINVQDNDNSFKVFHSYMDYMNDDEKQGQLFGKYEDLFNESDLNNIRKQFTIAQENESPMWQDVISFDNDFLEKIGVYESITGYVDESKLKNIARETIKVMSENEGMDIDTLEWTGAIHHNTDNIHIHLAITEPYPTREKENYKGSMEYRGKRKPKTLEKMKRCVAKNLYERNKDLQKIDELIREPVNKKRNINLRNADTFSHHFRKSLEKLPIIRSQWQYGYNIINSAREHIDAISNQFMKKFYPDELQELETKLDEQVDIARKLYGENSRASEYKDNKLSDLKKRLGNAVLQELKEFDTKEKKSFSLTNIKNFSETGTINNDVKWNNRNINNLYNKDISTQINISKFNHAMRKSYHDFKKERDMQEFDMMQEGVELE